METEGQRERPGLLVLARPREGFCDVEGLRADCRGPMRPAWVALRDRADREAVEPPLLPGSRFPGRSALHAGRANRDWGIVNAVCRRLEAAALAHLVTGEARFRDSALAQMEALFDPARWPDWRDLAHPNVAADLRTGSLAGAIGLAYDWLHPSLDAAERRGIVEGLDRCAVRPFLKSVQDRVHYVTRLSNWTACIAGGLGIAGMALGEDHPEAGGLVALSVPLMENYLECLGPDGEFNESVGYANALQLAVEFFLVHRYWTRGRANRLAEPPFPAFGRWFMAMTLPPGRLAALGDGGTEAVPCTLPCAAIAAAARDPLLQGFWKTYPEPTGERFDPVKALLWPDPALDACKPDGRLPKGRAFAGHGMVVSSRSDWNPEVTASVVYGKGGSGAELHGHHDAGQVCIDGYGRRLIIDPANPSNYPADYFGPNRWRYYNASAWGHNVLVFGGGDQSPDPSARARWLGHGFDDERGGWWTLDLTANYPGAVRVRRTVIHLLPALVAVLDEAELAAPASISLRWHTVDGCAPEADGRFVACNQGVRMAGRVIGLEGTQPVMRRGEHRYEPPFDRGRLGEPLDQRRERYVEAVMEGDRCRLLTLFAVLGPDEPDADWRGEGGAWSIPTARGPATAVGSGLRLALAEGSRGIACDIDTRA